MFTLEALKDLFLMSQPLVNEELPEDPNRSGLQLGDIPKPSSPFAFRRLRKPGDGTWGEVLQASAPRNANRIALLTGKALEICAGLSDGGNSTLMGDEVSPEGSKPESIEPLTTSHPSADAAKPHFHRLPVSS